MKILKPKFTISDINETRKNVYDYDGTWICRIELNSYASTDNQWTITQTSNDNYIEHVRYIRFASCEEAAGFYHTLHKKCKEIVENNPLPKDVADHLTDRARKLRDEERETLDRFHRIRNDRYLLGQLMKRSQIDRVSWTFDDSDEESLVRELLEFKVTIARHSDQSDQMPQIKVPFFSESALYSLIGKDDARSVLGFIHAICNCIAPNVVAGLEWKEQCQDQA